MSPTWTHLKDPEAIELAELANHHRASLTFERDWNGDREVYVGNWWCERPGPMYAGIHAPRDTSELSRVGDTIEEAGRRLLTAVKALYREGS